VHLGVTYPCYCTRREIHEAAAAPQDRRGGDANAPDGAYPGTCRELTIERRRELEASGRRPALRVRADDVRVAFVDRVRGAYEGLVDDVVIRRNDQTPAYNLAVIVDDALQGIGEVVRGDDLLSSTPRQLHLAALLDVTAPAYAHVPLVLAPDGVRLAKRDGAVTLADRRALGESADDVLRLLVASLGAAAPLDDRHDPRAPIDLTKLVSRFDPASLPRRPWTLTAAELRPGAVES